MTVTANKIEGKSFLILKNSNNGKVVECILLTDETEKFKEEPTIDPDDELREELEIL
ncbi:MAG: hypothetical protein IJL02_03970 [Methanobrevibacter sp.]|nr:hypothetical protein [Methanobrevibacter sp.]MBQ6099001.1 hypothetical protein [Methanobrevibacter sp.]